MGRMSTEKETSAPAHGLTVEACGSHFHVAYDDGSGEPLWSKEMDTRAEAETFLAKTAGEIEAGHPPARAGSDLLGMLLAAIAGSGPPPPGVDVVRIPLSHLDPDKDPRTLN